VRIGGEKKEAAFLARTTRFSALVELEGRAEVTHLPNSGRLGELLTFGRRVIVVEKGVLHRKTHYDLIMAFWGNKLVSVDARLPGNLVYEALLSGALPQFSRYSFVRREVTFGQSRLDFLLGSSPPCLLEVKSVTLVRRGVAMFPDAPTTRGTKHLRTLMEAAREGYRAVILFMIQREDADSFSPYDEADAEFGSTLREAALSQVEVYAHLCAVKEDEVQLARAVPIRL
jgi:sugar fermentation stimulation protein A